MKRKRKSQAKVKIVDLVEQNNTTDEKVQIDNILLGEEGLEESDGNNDTDFARESDSSDSDFY